MDESRERFLRAITERIPADRIEEVRLFQQLRQGGKESGVALIAVLPDESSTPPPPPADSWVATDAPLTEAEDRGAEGAGAMSADIPVVVEPPGRLTIYRAQYRLTLKGPERGKWEVDLVAEADAPLATVDDVVRGVRQRSGDDSEPERLTGVAVREALAEDSWKRTR